MKLKLSESTQMVNGESIDFYSLHFGDHFIGFVSVFDYMRMLTIVLKSNVVMENQIQAMVDKAIMKAKKINKLERNK